jgi:hypothetical protein
MNSPNTYNYSNDKASSKLGTIATSPQVKNGKPRSILISPKQAFLAVHAIAIHYFTEDNAIAILAKWVGCGHKPKTDIFSDQQYLDSSRGCLHQIASFL